MTDPKLCSSRCAAAKLALGLALLILSEGRGQTQTLRRDAEINGPRLNGVELVAPDGRSRLSLLAVRLKKAARLEGTRLLSAASGELLGPGALLEGEASDRAPVQLRIDRIATAPDPRPATPDNENADVSTYAISYQWGTFNDAGGARSFKASSDFAPLCPAGELAIPLFGRWDYHRGQRGDSGRVNADRELVTFACRGSAIAKCIEKMGYKPWLPPRPGAGRGAAVSMDALHQACVRAVRADYCGNGDSLTTEGQTVNFYDVAGVLKDTESWTFEAAWTLGGAACINRTRLKTHPEDPRQTVSGYIAKTCLPSWSESPCSGAKRTADALLFTETEATPAAGPQVTPR
jgi:hypothetical protein